MIGTAGTVTALAALDQRLEVYLSERVQGYRLHRHRIEKLLAFLGSLHLDERAHLPCLEPGRADLIIPGIAICLETMRVFNLEHLTVSDYGLREGILVERLRAM
jgi:exopolyphosphatase/guanosine-5'-triphosphate,3'-diphosphate pyrophosphatase